MRRFCRVDFLHERHVRSMWFLLIANLCVAQFGRFFSSFGINNVDDPWHIRRPETLGTKPQNNRYRRLFGYFVLFFRHVPSQQTYRTFEWRIFRELCRYFVYVSWKYRQDDRVVERFTQRETYVELKLIFQPWNEISPNITYKYVDKFVEKLQRFLKLIT